MSDLMNQPDPFPNQKRPAINPIGCDEVRDLIPAVALNAIETASALLVRSHCDACPACAGDLAASESVTAFLPFAVPVYAPPASAKARLMERIAIPAPIPAFAAFDQAIIDSPAAKRSAVSNEVTNRSNEWLGWTRDLVANKSMRIAAAPLAFALVFASLYSFGAFDRNSESATFVPTVQAAAANVGDSVESAAEQEVTFHSATTGGATVSPQSNVSEASGLTSTFMARSSRQATQTELMRSIVPKFAECEIAQGAGNTWHIEVSGVVLPDTNGPVDVYLVSDSGVMHEIGDVTLDEFGNGVITVTIDEQLSDYNTLQIGPVAEPLSLSNPGTSVSFQFDLDARRSLGLGKSG